MAVRLPGTGQNMSYTPASVTATTANSRTASVFEDMDNEGDPGENTPATSTGGMSGLKRKPTALAQLSSLESGHKRRKGAESKAGLQLLKTAKRSMKGRDSAEMESETDEEGEKLKKGKKVPSTTASRLGATGYSKRPVRGAAALARQRLSSSQVKMDLESDQSEDEEEWDQGDEDMPDQSDEDDSDQGDAVHPRNVIKKTNDTSNEAAAESGSDDSDADDDDDSGSDSPRRRRYSTVEFTTRGEGYHPYFRERLRLERAHPEILTMWDELDKKPVTKPEAVAQPASISLALKSFQLEGLGWMMKQEQTEYKGGLLGDEMGMGKTIQTVSLIMSDHPQKQPTLVMAPLVALKQWQDEINEYTGGKLKVWVHHKTVNKNAPFMTKRDLSEFDVILISYNTLESLYRRQIKGWKRAGRLVKANSVIHAFDYHRLILDEAHTIKSRTTGAAKACFALKGKYRWCVS